jgi:hypothetical protein
MFDTPCRLGYIDGKSSFIVSFQRKELFLNLSSLSEVVKERADVLVVP